MRAAQGDCFIRKVVSTCVFVSLCVRTADSCKAHLRAKVFFVCKQLYAYTYVSAFIHIYVCQFPCELSNARRGADFNSRLSHPGRWLQRISKRCAPLPRSGGLGKGPPHAAVLNPAALIVTVIRVFPPAILLSLAQNHSRDPVGLLPGMACQRQAEGKDLQESRWTPHRRSMYV